ncbi:MULTISPECIES: hypothetical protein [unclassified Ruminococcus]|uniref:hypothetical protein n=1 Tax=unclassified Ruminococcus TaxID=2608920 RepID=UPI00210911FD|nr:MULTISPECIES: hypothetical protein [unclassified Ruminococcus]MCQ4022763.1 hypothetical protein [Ruminococcus sp. zg-924]MCQ4115003.1 hypothetical protein [Ruminococcus sp. zg-921]
MKKIAKVLSSALLAGVIAVSATVAASAAGINAAEQKILDELHTTVTMDGVEKSIPASYINQAENYFNTVDYTEEQADAVIAGIEDAKAYIESIGIAHMTDLTVDQANTLVAKINTALSPVGLTLSYTKATGAVSIVDTNGKVVFSANFGSGAGNDPIKTTGADFNVPGVISVAGVGVLLVSAAGVYLFKAKKNEA